MSLAMLVTSLNTVTMLSHNTSQQWEGIGMDVSELIPLVVKFLATVKGFVGAVCFDRSAELLTGGAVLVSEGYRKELVIRIGVF